MKANIDTVLNDFEFQVIALKDYYPINTYTTVTNRLENYMRDYLQAVKTSNKKSIIESSRNIVNFLNEKTPNKYNIHLQELNTIVNIIKELAMKE